MVKKRSRATDEFELKQLRIEEKEARERRELAERRFKQSRTGRLGSFFGTVATQRRQQLSFARGIRGRRKGSFDPRYKQFGGVYGYRKMLNAQLRAQRLQQQRDATLSPQQQAILARSEDARLARYRNPENKAIPDTAGFIPMEHIFNEIDDAANLVK